MPIMKRVFHGLQRRATQPLLDQNRRAEEQHPSDSPEAIVVREITAFCEAGPGRDNADYVHLPAIVEAAESSPNAAKEAAYRIRKYLSNPAKPQGFAQYNAVMLIRILAENPGDTFTRNFDAKFVSTVKTFLRDSRDMASQHLLRETLDAFEAQKSWDENLAELLALWKKEKKTGCFSNEWALRSRASTTPVVVPPASFTVAAATAATGRTRGAD